MWQLVAALLPQSHQVTYVVLAVPRIISHKSLRVLQVFVEICFGEAVMFEELVS